jgi:hypothetical protein
VVSHPSQHALQVSSIVVVVVALDATAVAAYAVVYFYLAGVEDGVEVFAYP